MLDPYVLAGLDDAIGRDQTDRLLALMDAQLAETIAEMARAIADRNLPSLRATAHSAKGAASSVGAVVLADAARALETAPDDVTLLAERYAAFQNAAADTATAIAHRLVTPA